MQHPSARFSALRNFHDKSLWISDLGQSVPMTRSSAVLGILIACLTACVASPPGAIDPGGLAAVSRSKPDVAALSALDACSITDSQGRFGANGPLGLDVVIGMAQIPHARDTAKYVRLVGVEPEIQSDEPAWVIATTGPIQIPPGPKMWDATCVVVDGVPTWFITGDSEVDGAIVTPLPIAQTVTLDLPALAP